MTTENKAGLEPEIVTIEEKKLVGKRMEMSLADNRTGELWRSFMPLRSQVKSVAPELYSMQIYPPSFRFNPIDVHARFTKHAALEVADFSQVPEGMEGFVLPAGMYAVFHHKGGADTGPQVFGYIYGVWLLSSGYALDSRPHFELLGEKYKNGSPDSEEDIWIPVRPVL